MMFHLDREHKNLGEEEKTSEKPTQSKISAWCSGPSVPSRMTAKEKAGIDDALMKLLIKKSLPVSLVDNEHFREFVALLDERYTLPSRRTMNGWLGKKQERMALAVKKDLEQIQDIAITHDSWTSLATESYSCVTGHFIVDWQLRSVVLETIKIDGQHTSENIANGMRLCKSRWMSHANDPVAVTDNAANERKAFEQDLKWLRFGCFGHRINLIVKKAVAVPEMARLVGKGRKLVQFFHQSTSAHDELRAKQKLLFDMCDDRRKHNLKQDVATRWNSTYEMLARLVEQSPPLMAMATDQGLPKAMLTSVKNNIFSFDEQSMAEKLVDLLKPFYQATTSVCAEKNPTLQKVLLIQKKLIKVSQPDPDDSPLIKKVKSVLEAEIKHRTYPGDEELLLMATILNPVTKHLPFVSEEQKAIAKVMLVVKVQAVMGNELKVKTEAGCETDGPEELPQLPQFAVASTSSSTEVTEPTEQATTQDESSPKRFKQSCPDLDDWLMDDLDIVCVGQDIMADSEAARKEVDRYLSCILKDTKVSILTWWKDNVMFYPHIGTIAKKYLAIPASSVPSERVFSFTGNLVNKKRARLTPENVNMFVFLNKNMDYYW